MDEHTTERGAKPSTLPASWWNERRLRDYYVDASGCVKLRMGSETQIKMSAQLMAAAILLALPPEGSA